MTDLEINLALALAIGWTNDRKDAGGLPDPDIITSAGPFNHSESQVEVWFGGMWRRFDYREPSTIWPIAERYDAFPRAIFSGRQKSKNHIVTGWGCAALNYNTDRKLFFCSASTAAKAVALAVIGAAAQKPRPAEKKPKKSIWVTRLGTGNCI